MRKAKPLKYKNPDGYVWHKASNNKWTYASSGYLPQNVFALLQPTMPNPEHSPSGLWYYTEREAMDDLNRVLTTINNS